MVTLKSRNKRLLREYRELLASPIPNCSAQPLDENISVWHANIFVPPLELSFHFIIEYPRSYPDKAPKVKNCTYIQHQNVFGDYICLDILTMSEETANTPYRGWTSAYTISSLLVQLQSFLFEAMDKVSLDTFGAESMKNDAKYFVCSGCGHSTFHPSPEITCFEKACQASETTCTEIKYDYCFLDDCDNVVLSMLLEFVDPDTLGKLCFLLGDVTHVVDLIFARRSYKCFYTLSTLADPGVVFGLGAKKFIMPRRSRKTRMKTNQLQQLHCSFDYMSHDAFSMGVRNNIWKDRDIDCFIPLYINSEHGKRAICMAEECILNMWNCKELPIHYKNITADLILTTMTKLMNTTVVNMMKTVEDLEAGELQLFDSIKALSGYASMHHLLLAFCDRHPSIRETANARVKKFISDPQARDKENTPDVGELLVALAISDYCWDDFSPPWLEELFIRNARWILAKYPNLFETEKFSSCIRMTQSFNATRTGKRLAMFQRFFISEVASPERLQGNPNKNKILLQEYNDRLGMPPKGMAERLQEHSRKVIACNNWWDYFTLVDFCVPSAAHLSAWLRRSLEVSSLKQYHDRRQILRYPENFVSKPSEKIQLDCRHCLCAGSLYKLPETCSEIGTEIKESSAQLVEKSKIGVDICFVMDCTGSMTSILDTAKEHILSVVKTTSKKFNGETVRFAIVGYRDHDSPGWGEDSYVLKKFDFTDKPRVMQKNVKQFRVGGGGGPEAMCCAMAAAANMSWNRNSHQIVILIGDQPPHGYTQYSTYPDGCECGHDTLRVVHTMTKNGIAVYPVDCGYANGDRQTFYHALARISGGYAFDIRDAHLLPEIVVGACVQEGMMEKLAKVVKPFYTECLESHPLGRFEQHCQAVFSECKAKNVTVEASLPADGYDTTIEHQVDSIAFCTDIKQAKAVAESEYFCEIRRKTKLCSYMERPVSFSQVKTCLKRMGEEVSKAAFLKNGCQYLSSERFSKEQFKIRWAEFKSERKIRGFTPWNKLNTTKVSTYRRIPDQIRSRAPALRRPREFITHTLCGRTVEVELYGVWTSVKIIKLLANCKVSVKFGGVEFEIDDAQNWRPSTAVANWLKPKKESKELPNASPRLLRELNLVKSKPTSSPSPTVGDNASSDSGRSRASSFGHNFVMGQLVSCKNDEKDNWKLGVVACVAPLGIRFTKNGAIESCRFITPAKFTKLTLEASAVVYSGPGENFPFSSETLNPGTEVHYFEIVGDFAHIVNPACGWISLKSPELICTKVNPPSVEEPVVEEKSSVPHVEETCTKEAPLNTPVDNLSSPEPIVQLPMLNILRVPENATSKDLARLCMSLGVTPKRIKRVSTQQHGIVALIEFFSHEDARHIYELRNLAIFGMHMPIQWSPEYVASLPVRV